MAGRHHLEWLFLVKLCFRAGLAGSDCAIVDKNPQGLRATAVRVYRHLGFLKFESYAISSAVPEQPTQEPNSTSIGKPTANVKGEIERKFSSRPKSATFWRFSGPGGRG